MMGFSELQTEALEAKLRARFVRTRTERGKTLSYIEGWRAISEANRIFGFDGWSRETVASDCVWQGSCDRLKACSYRARVRITVHAGDTTIIREGSGAGHGSAETLGEAHESALKEAETDATKRALVTFGNPFGLSLYDRDRKGVTRGGFAAKDTRTPLWEIKGPDNELHSQHTDPVDYCANLRRMLEGYSAPEEVAAFWQHNQATIALLDKELPDLKSDKGQHYAEILGALYTARLKGFVDHGEDGSGTGVMGGDGGKSEGVRRSMELPKRIRDRDHLRFVASQPCLVCGRPGAQAHHLKFVQPRALGRKTGDQWTVPLCALHHRAVHDAGNEEQWWQGQSQDPTGTAGDLWHQSRNSDKN